MTDYINQMQVKVVTPLGVMLETTAIFVKAALKSGEIGIYPDHTPLLAELKPGELRLQEMESKTSHYFVPDGFVQVMPGSITIIASYFESADDIDHKRAKESAKRATQRLFSRKDDVDKARARSALSRAKERQYVFELHQKNRRR